jgi:hypothetical protein
MISKQKVKKESRLVIAISKQ